MSKESANTFIDLLEQDATLGEQWQAALRQAVQTAMVAMGSRHGTGFTVQELGDALAERERELSAEDVAKVSGGFAPQPEPPMPQRELTKLITLGMAPTTARF